MEELDQFKENKDTKTYHRAKVEETNESSPLLGNSNITTDAHP